MLDAGFIVSLSRPPPPRPPSPHRNRNQICALSTAYAAHIPSSIQLPLKWNMSLPKWIDQFGHSTRVSPVLQMNWFFSSSCELLMVIPFCFFSFFSFQILRNGQFQSRSNRRLKAKGRYATRRRCDCELQAREPDDVRLGNTRSITCGRYLLAGQRT